MCQLSWLRETVAAYRAAQVVVVVVVVVVVADRAAQVLDVN